LGTRRKKGHWKLIEKHEGDHREKGTIAGRVRRKTPTHREEKPSNTEGRASPLGEEKKIQTLEGKGK